MVTPGIFVTKKENPMKGYRTLILTALALVWVILAQVGIDVPADDQASIGAGVIALVSLVLRLVTTTPVGQSE